MKTNYTEDEEYTGDILFRVYYCQKGKEHINKNPKETFCFDIFVKEGKPSCKFCGQYTAEHPQGVRQRWLQLLEEESTRKKRTITFANEIEALPGLWLGDEFDGKDWFRKMYEWTTKEFLKENKDENKV